MVNRKMAVGFATWVRRVHGGGDDPMSRAVRYFVNRELSRGWRCWNAMLEALAAKRQAELWESTLSFLELAQASPLRDARDAPRVPRPVPLERRLAAALAGDVVEAGPRRADEEGAVALHHRYQRWGFLACASHG